MSTSKEHDVVDEVSTSNKKLAYNVHKGPKVTKLVRGPKDVTKVSECTSLRHIIVITSMRGAM